MSSWLCWRALRVGALLFALSPLSLFCSTQPELAPTPALPCSLAPLIQVSRPAHFPLAREPPNNLGTPLGRALGKRLFFEPRLAKNGKVSCASCHQPSHGFSVAEALTKRGVSGRASARHPPSLWNLAWADSGLFWDGGAKNLESQALGPLTHADELGHTRELASLLRTLQKDPQYAACFAAVFGRADFGYSELVRALAQYQRTLVAADARWDRREQGIAQLSPLELEGERAFERHCARCHSPPLFTDGRFHNNGLDRHFPLRGDEPERGRARISQRAEDLGKYKTPTLRNLSVSAPYMHDGRFATLAAVIDHYRHGIEHSSTLDPGFVRADGTLGVPLDQREVAGLEAFLRALDELEPAR